MASKTLGRVACPIGCGHTAAQVKLKTDKGEDKTAFPYVHCASCGIQLHTRNADQARHLLAMTRPEKGAEAPEPTPAPAKAPDPTPTPKPTPAPPVGAPGLFGGLFGGAA